MNQEIITGNDFEDAIVNFAKLNYKYLQVNGSIIFKGFKVDNYEVGLLSKRLVDSLVVESNIVIKASVVTKFLKILYSSILLSDKIDTAVTWMLRNYFVNNETVLAKQILNKVIELEFQLLQIQKDELLEIVNKLYKYL